MGQLEDILNFTNTDSFEKAKEIIFKRQLAQDSQTLEELSQHFKVSRERIRQIEENAIKKLKKFITESIH